MNKKCLYPDCDEEIFSWMKTCYKHKNYKGDKKMIEQNQYNNPTLDKEMFQQQPPQPPQQPPLPPPYLEPKTEVPQQSTSTPMQPKKNNVVVGEIPDLSERDRLIGKQTAFIRAIELFIATDYEGRTYTYEQMLGEIQRMTVDFFKIIVAKNEEF